MAEMTQEKKELRDLQVERGLKAAKRWQDLYGSYQELEGIFPIEAIDRIAAKRHGDDHREGG